MDTIDQQDPVATARVPLLAGLRLQLTKSLLRGESYYSLMKYWPAMAEDAAKLPDYLLSTITQRNRERNEMALQAGFPRPYAFDTRTEEYLKTRLTGDSRLFEVYHAIPRQLLQSLVLGTVAWDYHPSRGKSREHYGEKPGIGIYAFGLSVKARNGEWLTANEVRAMVAHIEEYIAGHDAWLAHDGLPITPRDKQLHDFVTQIDNHHGTHDTLNVGPRFCGNASQRCGLRDLARSLTERMRASLQLDPKGDTPMIQSPLYIGCSTILEKRMLAHDPNTGKTSALKRSNKLLALIMSLMKCQDLEPETIGVPVLRLWKEQDLDFSETLICSFAQSMACQDGCNMVECGDAKGKNKSDSSCEDYVKARLPYLHDNIVASLHDLKERQAFVDQFSHFQPLLDGVDSELIDRTSQMVGKLQELLAGMNTLEKEYERAASALQEKNRQMEANSNLMDNLIGLYRSLNLGE
ncbi:hypothetical protein N0V82_008471 [Gnomoniopsis sp. IMI 355080]|nr:hypothetical protein N0V82_008471 [Gnomoniopsis sp. IMI 355080]